MGKPGLVWRFGFLINFHAVESRLPFPQISSIIFTKVEWFWNLLDSFVRVCLHGDGGPQVGEVTLLGGVTRLSIYLTDQLNIVYSVTICEQKQRIVHG